MSHEPWGSVTGASIALLLGIAIGASVDDASHPRDEPAACPAVPGQVTTTTGTLPPEVRP